MNRTVFAWFLLAMCAGAQAALPRRQLTQVSPDTCRSLFNQAGGISGLTRFLPACVPGDKYNAEQCCNQAKGALNLAPQASQCLCNLQEWNEVRSQAGAAGFGGTLADFLKTCGIKVAGSGC